MEDLTWGIGEWLAAVAEEDRRRREAGADRPVSAPAAFGEIRRRLESAFDFEAPVPPAKLLLEILELLAGGGPDTAHPRSFGMFHPGIAPAAVGAEALVALLNPQLALRAHAPAATEMEAHVLRYFLSRIGWDPATAGAHFTNGGQEANLTAILAALADRFPEVVEDGLRSLPGAPVLYLSDQGHPSVEKAALVAGLGRSAVRRIPVGSDSRMEMDALRGAIGEDRRAGRIPFLVTATAGTTSAGAIDPLPELAHLCGEEGLWLHADAAWGGIALLSDRLRPALAGIERAQSIAWDAHKTLPVPLTAGMFFTRRPAAAERAFWVAPGGYAPDGASPVREPYAGSLPWSRRFLGLKVFLVLAERGAAGIRNLVDSMADRADELRAGLVEAGWRVVNRTPLPLVCFTHPRIEGGALTTRSVVRRVQARGRTWVSEVSLPGCVPAIRACVTNGGTTGGDVAALLEELGEAVRPRPREGGRGR